MKDLGILMPVKQNSFVTDEIEKNYRLHKLWEAPDPKAFIERVKDDVRFIITSPRSAGIDGPFMAQFPNLQGVVNFGVGYDVIDAVWAAAHGVMVTHTPDILNDEVADMALGLLLGVIRQLPQADRFVREGSWTPTSPFPLSASLAGRTMGILGLGRIGKAIAKRAEAFGLKIIYHGRTRHEGVAYPYYENLLEMAKACDILMVVAPATPATRHIVNAELLKALGSNGVLVNVARGSLVDEEALIEALEAKTILSAALDVFASEPNVPPRLLALPQVVLSPHIGSASEPTIRAMAQLVHANLDALAEGRPALTPVPEMTGFKRKVL